jgi:hypothetical protein
MKPDNTSLDGEADGDPEDLSTNEDSNQMTSDDKKIAENGDAAKVAYAIRRNRHNIKEKERKEKIKGDMQEIRSMLPPEFQSEKKQTHHELLQLGIQFMHSLIYQNGQLLSSSSSVDNSAELERLRKENEELKMESMRYRSLLSMAGVPLNVDPSQIAMSWRYRAAEEMNSPYIMMTDGTNHLQTTSHIVPRLSTT